MKLPLRPRALDAHSKPAQKVLSTQHTPETLSPLLRLPPKLRNLIYYWTLAPEDGIIRVTKSFIQARTAICRTNRQLREEALDVLLRFFRFRIDCGLGAGLPAVAWLESLGPRATRITCFYIAIGRALKLRHRFAESLRYRFLNRFMRRTAHRVRRRAYDESYLTFLADFAAVHGWLTRHVPMDEPSDGRPPASVWRPCAPSNRVQMRVDEFWYMDRVEAVLRAVNFAP